MNEELIISGRNIPGIDPHLHVWHWPIALDLFMGGLAAGILFFTAWYVIADKPMRSEERRVGKECRSRWSPYH